MKTFKDYLEEKRGLWDNIHAKRARIKNGSGERMRKPGSKGAPSEADLKAANEETEIEEATPYYNKPSFLKKMSRAAKQEQQAREKKEAEAKKPVKEELSNDDKSSIALRALVAKKNLKQAEGKKMSADFYKKMNDRVDAGKKLNKLHQEQSREEQFDMIETTIEELALRKWNC